MELVKQLMTMQRTLINIFVLHLKRKRWYVEMTSGWRSALQCISEKNDRQQLFGINNFKLQSADNLHHEVLKELSGRCLACWHSFLITPGVPANFQWTGKGLSVRQGFKKDNVEISDMNPRPNNREHDMGFKYNKNKREREHQCQPTVFHGKQVSFNFLLVL